MTGSKKTGTCDVILLHLSLTDSVLSLAVDAEGESGMYVYVAALEME
jgi:hypothetical protein